MAVIGATQLEPVNVLGQYVQGLEAGRATRRQRATDEAAMMEAQRTAELRNFLTATPDLTTPEAQNQLMRFGKPGAEVAASFADIAGKRATAEKTGLEARGLEVKMADENYGRFQRTLGNLAYGETPPTKAQVLDEIDFMIAQGILAPPFRDYAAGTLSNDPVTLEKQIKGQFLSQVPPADRVRLFMPTAGETLSAQTARRGQDIAARTAVRGQDIAATTATRGQDIGAETARRGQDITMRGQDMTATVQSPEYQARVTSARERAISDVKFSTEFSSAETTAQRTLTLLDDLIGDAKVVKGKVVVEPKGRKPMEGFTEAVGAAVIPGQRFIPGTDARNFNAVHDQAVGAAFMQAFATLKGGGQITEKEGEKATAALTRMNLAQSESEYIRAAREFKSEVETVMEIARTRYNTINPSAQSRNAKPGTKATSSGTPYEVLGD